MQNFDIEHEFDHSSHMIAEAWSNLLSEQEDWFSLTLLSAFFSKYADEETNNVSSKPKDNGSSKNFIVTNFVAYSKFVEAVVNRAIQVCGHTNQVVCFTTLSMPLSKWFNFKECKSLSGIDFRYFRVHDGWASYIQSWQQLLAVNSHNLVIERCLLAVEDAFAEEHAGEPDFGFKGEAEIKAHTKLRILVPEIPQPGTIKALEWKKSVVPIEVSAIPEKFQNPIDQNLIDLYDNVEQNAKALSNKCYLICPDGRPLERFYYPVDKSIRHEWLPLSEVFSLLFHVNPNHAFFSVLNRAQYKMWFGINDLPQDLFMIGLRGRSPNDMPKWYFCLAAHHDDNLDKLSLEFVTPHLNSERFNSIVDYVNSLRHDSQDRLLTEW